MLQAGMVDRSGGPFGAVVVRNGAVLGAAGNSVLQDQDPTAHAEVNAIREACRATGRHDLIGTALHPSGARCPKCDATAYRARISKVYVASRWSDDADLFDDTRIHTDMTSPTEQRQLTPEALLREDGARS